MISERTLKQWRREALIGDEVKEGALSLHTITRLELDRRILRMTQELLDLHLVKK
jgi:hypothetical protein